MKYVQILDFISNLTDKFDAVDTDLPIFEEHLARLKLKLGNDGYTYLGIKDGYNFEIIKVTNTNNLLSVERGLEESVATTFPKGSCIQWLMTASAVRDIVCQMPCCPEEETHE